MDLKKSCFQLALLLVYNYLLKYLDFFDLFRDFRGYVHFFLTQDLVSENHTEIMYYLPFEDFIISPKFRSVDDYITYKEEIIDFITKRNRRIDKAENS